MVFTIGIDPHKATHTAAVVDGSEAVVAELRFAADRHQRDRVLSFAARFAPRSWAIEQATGLGALLAQQLVAVGETVFDVPPTLSARVRLLDSTHTDKTDAHDARAAAIVALRHPRLRAVALIDHTAVLRLLADRHHDLVALRTQAVCRLHALLCQLTAGGVAGRLSAQRAAEILRRLRALEPVSAERKRVALELLGDLRRFDNQLMSVNERIVEAVLTSDNPRGNRQLNCALHVAAITQVAHDTDGRAYYQRKLAESKTRKEALRALKRQISNAVYRRLVADTQR